MGGAVGGAEVAQRRPRLADVHRKTSGVGLSLAVLLAAMVVSVLLRALVFGAGDFLDLWVYRDATSAALGGAPAYDLEYGPFDLPFTYPPFALLVFAPLTALPQTVAGWLVYGLSVAALVDSCVTLQRWGARESWRSSRPALVAAVALFAEPVTSTLGFGQVNLVLMALLLRDASGRTPLPQGVLTGLAAGLKLTPAAFGLYYLATGRITSLRNAVLTGAATVAAGALAFPGLSATFWLSAVSDPARPGDPWYARNQSLTGVCMRVLGADVGLRVAYLLAVPVVLGAGWLAWRAHRHDRDVLAFGAVATVPLLVSPISWNHHWVLLLPALVALSYGRWRVRAGVRLGLVGFALVVLVPHLLQFLPEGHLVELSYPWPLRVASAMYPALALGWLAIATREVTLLGAAPDGARAGHPPGSRAQTA